MVTFEGMNYSPVWCLTITPFNPESNPVKDNTFKSGRVIFG